MMTMKWFGLMALGLLFTTSCKKDSDTTTPTYPKKVQVGYRMSVTQGSLAKVTFISYVNSSGGTTNLDDVSLPYTLDFSTTVNKLDDFSLSFFENRPTGSEMLGIKLELLVDGKVMKTETFESSSSLSGAAVYFFP
jgi:hypothetical protein